MQALNLTPSEEVSGFKKVCEVPNWLADAVSGLDIEPINSQMSELMKNQQKYINSLDSLKKEESCVSAIHQAIKKSSVTKSTQNLTCVSAKSTKLSKGMML